VENSCRRAVDEDKFYQGEWLGQRNPITAGAALAFAGTVAKQKKCQNSADDIGELEVPGIPNVPSDHMENIERSIRERYLSKLASPGWDDEDPRLDYGSTALPYFIKAFHEQRDDQLQARLVRIIWHFRDPSALEVLGIALSDSNDDVWKDALDGIVTLNAERGMAILQEAREAARVADNKDKLSWIEEAIEQLSDRKWFE